MKQIISKLPEWAKRLLKKLWGLSYYGNARFCPLCGKSSNRFDQFGLETRKDAACPCCNALERHRLMWLFLNEKTTFFDGKEKKVLHVAPEQCFETKIREVLGQGY